MYLPDKDIRAMLGDIDFGCRFPEHPFNSALQINGASVDLRLDTVFWLPKKEFTRRGRIRFIARNQGVVDLRSHRLHEAQPRFHWRRLDMELGDTRIIEPGGFLMGRIYEEMTIPNGFAGKFAARVSYARMGLMVHCGADFINPGWRGHHPVQLVNVSSLPIRITPMLPIAQITFVKLTQPSDKVYDASDRYMSDDGGPSYWWRDQLVVSLADSYGEDSLPASVSRRLNDIIASELFSGEQLYRFKRIYDAIPAGRVESTESLLEIFIKTEKRKEIRAKIIRSSIVGLPAILVGGAIGAAFTQPVTTAHWLYFMATVLVCLITVLYLALSEKKAYFDRSKWDEYNREIKITEKRAT
ncbi:dCTP deaminase [Mycobacteroides abscessus]|uniref:dCTP deaminase n=1 Tax=Mycobacteroides abscessus TaxID=36809 RepID=UPI0009289EBC|nr:hypothetical protein [Mycobacteroides abscessus]SHV16240.1 deoxycytidine triphosphate deaminase [Mycobacteroides abscessus subsp. abscessus]SHV36123.1 deoxycytidine triphosphate deaminase [Mycobacteroides abscessus subsp. abscessus]SHV57961.1 deoxycytidine triphosphate deaminase [Mycobacteroides abscessus subsp. abscessus]SHW24960.1 deoxycytidine triphosphate deaminase [Mycobacteroides abscessus subsp. abscessus]SHW62273.1 deoxycytidine triphosphate deaminase [Mycobacteroides abscessus subs